MRRKLSIVLALALLVTSAFGLAMPSQAHPVNLDPALETAPPNQEWNTFGVYNKTFSETNLGRVIRNTQQQGEYAWQDATGPSTQPPTVSDARIIASASTTQTRQLDIRQFRITATPTDLYIYVSLLQLSSLGGILQTTQRPFLPQLQVAIDTGTPTSGATTFVAPANAVTQIKNQWEYLVRTQFDSIDAQVDTDVDKINRIPPLVYNGATPTIGALSAGEGVLSQDGNSIELRVPWSELGGTPAASTPVRFSVATVRSDGAVPGDGVTDTNPSNIVDVVSRVVNNTVLGNDPSDTVAAITRGGSSNTLDYAPQVYFDANAEPYSPLLISEISIRPKGAGSALNFAQWFEIANTSTTASFNLSEYKAGDATDPSGTEAMYQLPNVTLAPSEALIFTRQRNAFKNVYGDSLLPKTYELTTTNTIGEPSSVGFQLAQYSGWGGLAFSLGTTLDGGDGTIKDQVVLLNSDDTLTDLVEYANDVVPDSAWYPEQRPVPVTVLPGNQTVNDNTTFVRCPFTRDTNNGLVDFITINTKAEQTPGTPTCSIADLYTSVTGAAGVVVDALNPTNQNYTVTYGNNRAPVVGATIAITLPRAMTLVSATSTPDIGQPAVSTSGDGRVLLTWSNVSSAFGAQGTINLTLQVPAGTNPNPATNLQATFGVGAGTTDSTSANNSTIFAVTYSAQPFADVGISITNKSTAEFFPGGKMVYGVTVTNAGTKQADDVTVEIDVPDFLTYKGNNQNFPASVNGNKTTLSLGAVAAGSPSVTTVLIDVEFTVSLSAVVGANAQATAVVKTVTLPETPTTNNVSATSPFAVKPVPDAPDVEVVKVLKTTGVVKQGDLIAYTITVRNKGTQPIASGTNILLYDDYPELLLKYEGYQSPGNDIGAQDLGERVRFSLRGGLAAGQSVVIEVFFNVKPTVANDTKVMNVATVDRVPGESTDANNTSNAVLTVNPAAPGGNNKVFLPLVAR